MTEKIKKKKKSIQSSKIFQKGKRKLPTMLLLLIVGIGSFLIGKKIGLNTDTSKTNTKIEEVKVEKQTITKTLTSSGEIDTTQTERLYLSTLDYYLSATKEVDNIVKQGDVILSNTSGAVLTAPYDFIVTSINTPNILEQVNNNHSIGISSINALKVELNVSESLINEFEIGRVATIKIPALENKTYEGVVTSISNTASNKKFSVTIEFENDGKIYLGMSATISL